ncbi:MAG: dephospho-CoA kinase [Acidimicrobiales bacterium]
MGLTGGIGSGKSTVADLLADRGASVLDADAVTRELQRPGQSVYEATVERFGPDVVSPDGALDRRALARVVFDDPGALAELESLTHPAVAASMAEHLSALAGGASGAPEVVVLEVPLLLETGHYQVVGVVVVDCPVDTAVARLTARRGMTDSEARARLARQMPREERLARADFVIDNAGPPEALPPQVDQAWAWMLKLPDP